MKVKKITSAWVIYLGGSDADRSVISVLSSRRKAEEIQRRIEHLYALLYYDLFENLNYFGQYNPTKPPYPSCSSSFVNNSENYAIWHSVFTCGHNPWITAELGSEIEIIKDVEQEQILKWKQPDRVRIDIRTNARTIENIGGYVEAPFRNLLIKMAGEAV
jgi:hypothetical protein